MSIRVSLKHETKYKYSKPISLGPQLVRLRPAAHCRMPILSYSLDVKPEKHFINWQQDPYGNWIARFVFPEKTDHFSLKVGLVADIDIINPFDFFIDDEGKNFPFEYPEWLNASLAPYLEKKPQGKLFNNLLKKFSNVKMDTVGFVVDLNAYLQSQLNYLIRMDAGVQTPDETLEKGSGSCRDFAWLQVQLLRHLGLAARFVSGYSIQLKPDVKSIDGPSGVNEDVTDLHAWAEVYLPGAGWLGLDATSGMVAGEGYIPLACTSEPLNAAPVSGSLEACDIDMDVSMEVLRVNEQPRSTKPYPDDTWKDILKAGDEVDKKLQEMDVRLTMGGEPTFVSIDDMESEEWNVSAVGKHKRELSETLVKRLAKRFAPTGLLHYGQGKWYPGEDLPRWALSVFWRKDGEPLWHNRDLIADTSESLEHSHEDARKLLAEIADNLGAGSKWIFPAFDPPEWPGGPKGSLRGYVLPLHRNPNPGWISGNWHLHGDGVVLIPGQSPVGLRLPIEQLVDEDKTIQFIPFDPSAPRPELPLPMRSQPHRHVAEDERNENLQEQTAGRKRLPKEGRDFMIRTAMAVEVRDGIIHLFLPPLTHLEYFIELLDAVEPAVEKLGLKIVIDGYEPPQDHRLNVIKVTPDPGVIEVNVHPVSSWKELVESTELLYEEARQARLGTEKFLIDGRHTGTGGGNHVVIGGATTQDSPLLRRPDLLASMLRFWHNHPSFSYTFSGLFIGPTSQHPRIDEGRLEKTYEFEIALAQVPMPEEERHVPPWLVDRIFRHLLTDLTGNTHRSEFCIDKLYSPDSTTGRLGLLELRSFEMPPHAQMSLAQGHLIRSCVAGFWNKPYTEELIKWGTALHDKFMLHHFACEDLNRAIKSLKSRGIPMEMEWFKPHLEFRYPKYGEITYEDVVIEFRHALEPWHTLGEEPAAGGTARFVDSSVERLEIRVRNFPKEKFVLTCNGRRVPLYPTENVGEAVAGVRYRAWQPIHCLHPTLKAQTPLIFNLIEISSQLAVAGARYHVGHPAGRNYEDRPINSKEAASRRHARFEVTGMTAGRLNIPPAEENALYPVTLDLRRPAKV